MLSLLGLVYQMLPEDSDHLYCPSAVSWMVVVVLVLGIQQEVEAF